MFVLTLKPGDEIKLTGNGDTTVKVISNFGNELKVGFEAPRSVRIKHKKNREARRPKARPGSPVQPLGLSHFH